MSAFRKVLSAFRIVPTMPPAQTLQPFASGIRNGDLSCDENGALYVRNVPGSGGNDGAGALPHSAVFSTGTGTGLVQTYELLSDAALHYAAIQSIQAHATTQCYLQLHNVNTPPDGAACVYEWACPYGRGFSQEFAYPWGLRNPGNAPGMTFAFSSTPSLLTTGPWGFIQGIITLSGI